VLAAWDLFGGSCRLCWLNGCYSWSLFLVVVCCATLLELMTFAGCRCLGEILG